LKKQAKEYVLPAIVAMIIATGMILLVPNFSGSNILVEAENRTLPPGELVHYRDMDHDGCSEAITFYPNEAGDFSVSVSELTLKTINQFNLRGEIPIRGDFLGFHDINQDSIEDLLICTVQDSNLYLTIVDDLYSHPTSIKEYLIDQTSMDTDLQDYLLISGGLGDLNGDGYQEYVFGINTGYALKPRRVYAIDYQNQQVLRSPLAGAAITGIQLFDLDQDGSDEVLLNTAAPENYKYHVPFRDSVSWLMILDDSLHFYKDPIPLSHSYSAVYIEPFSLDLENYIMVCNYVKGINVEHPSIAVYDYNLEQLNSREYLKNQRAPSAVYRKPGGYRLSDMRILFGNTLISVDQDLIYLDSIENEFELYFTNLFQSDLDGDEDLEIISIHPSRLSVFNQDLELLASVGLDYNERYPWVIGSVLESRDERPIFVLQADRQQFYFFLKWNPYHRYRILFLFAIASLMFFVFVMLLNFQQRVMNRKFEIERRFNLLQLESIKNQLDPHFTYNTLNAIGSLIYQEKKELAYHYLKGLTELLRTVTRDSAEKIWPIAKEIDYMTKYLELEKLRFQENFSYDVRVELNSEKEYTVPKLAILSFVENALKHGLRNKEGKKKLSIQITEVSGELKILIEDNGIGRLAAETKNDGDSGSGLEMIQQYFELLESVTGIHARYEMIDLIDKNQKAAGTRVVLFIRYD